MTFSLPTITIRGSMSQHAHLKSNHTNLKIPHQDRSTYWYNRLRGSLPFQHHSILHDDFDRQAQQKKYWIEHCVFRLARISAYVERGPWFRRWILRRSFIKKHFEYDDLPFFWMYHNVSWRWQVMQKYKTVVIDIICQTICKGIEIIWIEVVFVWRWVHTLRWMEKPWRNNIASNSFGMPISPTCSFARTWARRWWIKGQWRRLHVAAIFEVNNLQPGAFAINTKV